MINDIRFQNYIRNELAQGQAKNPGYSIRALARKLGVSSGTLSMVLRGERKLSAKSVSKVLDRMSIDPETRSKLIQEFTDSKSSSQPKKTSSSQTQLAADQYFIHSEWYYFAILSLLRIKKFNAGKNAILDEVHDHLGISRPLAKQAIERMERLKLIHLVRGKYARTHESLSSPDGVQIQALRKSHQIHLDLARTALEEQPADERDFTFMTFAFDPKQLNNFKKRIREFQNEIAEEFSKSENASEVVRFATQFFNLTQTKGKKEVV